MNKWILLLGLITTLLSSTTQAEDYKSYGLHSVSCGSWTQERKEKINTPSEAWILGFISGAGWAGRNMAYTDIDAVFGWIDHYCKENPLDNLIDAAEGIIATLEAKYQ